MTLYVEVSAREEAWLAAQSVEQGLPPAEIIKQLIDAQLPSEIGKQTVAEPSPVIDAKNAAAIAYLDARLAADAADDTLTISEADQDFEDLKRNLNANRAATGERAIFP